MAKKHNSAYKRPDQVRDEVKDELFSRMRSGETLTAICADKHMPSKRTVHYWVAQDPDFAAEYYSAWEPRSNVWAEEIIEIADGRDVETDDNIHVARDRLRVDARWRLLQVLNSKFADRHEVNHKIDLAEAIVKGLERAER